VLSVAAGGNGAFYLPLVDKGDDDDHHSASCEVDEIQAAVLVGGMRRGFGVLPVPTSRQMSLSKSTGALNSTSVQGIVQIASRSVGLKILRQNSIRFGL
jgi:hypothetical protein